VVIYTLGGIAEGSVENNFGGLSVHGSLISITWKATDACLCRYHKRGFSGRFMVVVSVLFDQIVAMDLEGIACKRLDSPYKVTGKPSPYWIKVKNSRYSQLKGREELFDRVFSLLIPGMIP